MKKFVKLVGAMLICSLPGIAGGFFTVKNLYPWFNALAKPAFSPPSQVFFPVWTILYTLMGISLFLILETKPSKDKTQGIIFFAVQLVLNGLWSFIFFGLHQIMWSFVCIVFLLLFIALSMFKFYKISKTAAYLLVPYILWVGFATALNFSLYLLNS